MAHYSLDLLQIQRHIWPSYSVLQNFLHCLNQHLRLFIRTDGNSQKIADARRLGKMTHDNAALAQSGSKFGTVAFGMAGKNEIGGGRQDHESQAAQFSYQRFPGSHNLAAGFLELSLGLNRSLRPANGETIQWVGVETVLNPDQRLNQVRLANGVANAQSGQ